MANVAGVAELVNLAMQQKTNSDMIDNQNRLLHEQQRFQVEQNDKMYSTYRNSLEKAGLNINAMFGGYPNTQSTVPQSAQLTAPQINSKNILEGELLEAQRANIEADTKLKNKQGNLADANAVLAEARKWQIEQLTPAELDNLRQSTNKTVQQIENLKVEQALTDATIGKVLSETVGQELQNYLTQESTPLILKQYATNIALMNSQKDLNVAQTAAAYKSLQVMCAQINELNTRAKYNTAQANYVATAMVGLALSNDYQAYRNSFKSDFVHQELKMNDSQIKQAEQAAEQMRVSTEFAPLTAISGAAGGFGVAVGGVATGLNQGQQFMKGMQKPAKIGFNR